MRYFGQNYHREIPIVSHAPIDRARTSTRRSQAFHADYAGSTATSSPDEVVEIVGVIVTAIGRRAGRTAHFSDSRAHAMDAERLTRASTFARGGFLETDDRPARARCSGDARSRARLIVEEALSTTLVPPGRQRSASTRAAVLLIDTRRRRLMRG